MNNTILTRGTVDVLVRDHLEKKLKSGKPLRIKLGIDPTGSDLHLGHAVVLRKLRQFQEAGHTIIFLFGGFTAIIGDPTGKSETRPPLTPEEVENNAAKYLKQASKIIDIEKAEIRNNREWLEPMTMRDILGLMSKKSAQQILARRDFKERYEKEIDIHVHEFMYPMLQGYDSVVLESDVEIGGTDQLFNLLVGRDLQKKYNCKVIQDVLTVNLIEGIDGTEKMSKSLGNYIALDEKPSEMFGKIMSIPDNLMIKYYECLTDEDLSQIDALISESPRDAKVKLAQSIVSWLHDEDASALAFQDFETKFVKKEVPDEMPDFKAEASEIGILNLITKVCSFASSNGEARRIIQGGGVSMDGEKITDPQVTISLSDTPQILKVGKRKFGRICA